MRKVILNMSISLDGFIEGPNREMNWTSWDKEWRTHINRELSATDTILCGRVAYQNTSPPQAGPSGTPGEKEFNEKMSNMSTVVFSRTLTKVEGNAMLIKDNIPEEMAKLKQQPGKDLLFVGGANIVTSFIRMNLIDEYRLAVNPVILGSGKPLFKDNHEKRNLRLLDTVAFNSGVVIFYYKPET